MIVTDISGILTEIFGTEAVTTPTDASWQVDNNQFRLLVLLSETKTWLRLLIPIVAAADAQPYFEQFLAANFETTQQTHYAIHQDVLWGVFQHNLASLTDEDFRSALSTLLSLHRTGLDDCFNQLVEVRVRQIIQAAKTRGQSKESTIQTLERFYQEGMLGGLQQTPQQREQFLSGWRYQLDRLWDEY
jgi:hypothetical protein